MSPTALADFAGLLVAIQGAALGFLVSINARLSKQDERLTKVEAKFDFMATILGKVVMPFPGSGGGGE